MADISKHINLEPGIAGFFLPEGDSQYDILVETVSCALCYNGFTVRKFKPPTPQLANVVAIRRINLCNLDKNAYCYASLDYFRHPDESLLKSVDKFVHEALKVIDPVQGDIELEPLYIQDFICRCASSLSFQENTIKESRRVDECLPVSQQSSEGRIFREEETTVLESEQSSEEILKSIEKLVQSYVLKEHSTARISEIIESFKNRIVVTTQKPSRIEVSENLNICLPDFDGMELNFTPKMRAVYCLFLRHPDGIYLKSLNDYLHEMTDLLLKASKGKYGMDQTTAKMLCDPDDGDFRDMYSMISKINRVIGNQIQEFSGLTDLYRITGRRSERYKIEIAPRATFR